MRRLVTVLSLVVALALTSSALADAPTFMPVQGFLTDADGQPVTGDVLMTLRLWDDMTVGQALFTEVQHVLVQDGFFTLDLGAQGDPALDLSLFRDHGTVYLGLQVGDEAEMAPRLPLGTVPYAGYAQYAKIAGDSEMLGGRPAADYRLGEDAVSWDDLDGVPDTLLDGDADTLAGLTCQAGEVAKWDGTGWACAADIDTDADTLAGLTCQAGEVAKWDGAGWACAADIDTDTTLVEAEVDAMVANNGYALEAALAAVATSGSFLDLVDVPADLLDGDADTLAGLSCTDSEVAKYDQGAGAWACAADLDTDSDTLATLHCGLGEVAKWNGLVWECAEDIDTDTNSGGDITGVSAGTGLSGGGLSGDVGLSVNIGVIQSRVVGTCSAGSSISAIDENGNVTCEADNDSGGDITGVTASTGLSGGGTSGDVALAVDTGVIQARVTGNCSVGSAIRAIDSSGNVTCEPSHEVRVGGGHGWTSAASSSGTYFFPGTAWIADFSGTCAVTVTARTDSGSVETGTFDLRTARESNGSNTNDYSDTNYGMVSTDSTYYFGTATDGLWTISAGASYRFGCYVRSSGTFTGNTFWCRVSYVCAR